MANRSKVFAESGQARFLSLAEQVAASIRSAIDSGRWTGRLPGERVLSESMQVGRRTIRNALALLVRERLIETIRGVGHKIVGPVAREPGRPARRELVVILKEPLHAMRPFTVLWLDILRAGLARKGIPMELVIGKRPFSSAPGRALARMTAQMPDRVWLMVQSHEEMQVWFQKSGVPCIISGSPSGGIQLPSVDLDHRALCRHAVGTLWRAGHRRIAYLTRLPPHMGDTESENGFLEGFRQLAGRQSPARIHRFAPDPEKAAQVFHRILLAGDRPTGIVVGQSSYYLTLLSVLAAHRLRVPQDISVVVRDNESFFRFLQPKPAAYGCPPVRLARAIQKLVVDAVSGVPPGEPVRIMPEFIRGDSVEAVPVPESEKSRPGSPQADESVPVANWDRQVRVD